MIIYPQYFAYPLLLISQYNFDYSRYETKYTPYTTTSMNILNDAGFYDNFWNSLIKENEDDTKWMVE